MSSPIILCRVKALYTFEGTEPTALNFDKGDSIDVLAQLDSGWWDGWCNGKRGWFPSNYVEVIDELIEDLEVDQQDGLELGGLMSDRRSSRELQTQRISTTAAVPLDIKHHRLSFTGMASDDPKSDSSNSYEQQTLLLDNTSGLPPGWRLQLTDNGHVFYNEVTGEVRHNLDIDEDNASISESAEDDELLDQSEPSQSQSRDSQSHQSRDSLSQSRDSQSHQSRDSLSQSRDSQSHQSRDSQPQFREDNTRSVYSESMDESSVFEADSVGMPFPLDGVTLPEHWVSEISTQGKPYFRHQITNDIAWDIQSVLQGTHTSFNSVADTSSYPSAMSTSLSTLSNAPIPSPRSQSRQAVARRTTLIDLNEPLTWSRMFSHIALAIHNLNMTFDLRNSSDYKKCVTTVVNAIRLMLFGSHTLDKESIHLKNSRNLKAQHRNIMTSVSKLVLTAKAASEALPPQFEELVAKIKEESMDLLGTVQNFVTQCQDMHITIRHIDPRIVDSDSESRTHRRSDTASSGPITLPVPTRNRRPLSTEVMTRLQTHDTKLQASLDSLQSCVQKMLHQQSQTPIDSKDGDLYSTSQANLPILVAEFKETIKHLGHWLALLDTTELQYLEPLDQNVIKVNKQRLYNNSGLLFSAIQLATDDSTCGQVSEVSHVGKDIEIRITRIMNILEQYREEFDETAMHGPDHDNANPKATEQMLSNNGIISDEPSAIDLMNDEELSDDSLMEEFDKEFRKHGDTGPRHSENLQRDQTAELSSLASSRSPTDKLRKFFGEDAAAAAAANYSPKQAVGGNVWYLGYEYRPHDIMFSMEGSVRGGTLPALIERLTLHDYLDMNFIATFLLTYRSFCTTEELMTHLQKRYTLAPPEELTMEELEIWVEKKLKLVRLRVFNVLKTWVENYYYQEDYGVLENLRQFTITVIRDTLTFSAEQLERLINMRLERDSQYEMKKMISNNNSIAPMPILPRNMKRIRLLDVDSVELARQLTIIDFKLYSAIRPIECLDKAWSRDDETGKTASNIKASILFCNQVTAWVSDSILSQHEAKKRAAILKHWVQVAERCRMLGNFNTCMAILSAFDNSAIGRLKRTWEIVGARTNQTLAQIRKLMGHEKNFIEYREIIHSINPPCIPFLGIYLQDLTFIEDGNSNYLKKTQDLINFAKRMKTAEVIREIQQYQSVSYSLQPVRELQLFIKTHLENSRDEEILYSLSVALEPKEREDEKIARLLQESGFL